MEDFNAIGATGVIMDVRTGELVSMVSLPDFDPQRPSKGDDAARFNRATLGAYEMGSTFKSFTMAMAMEYGTANMHRNSFFWPSVNTLKKRVKGRIDRAISKTVKDAWT